MSLIRKRGIAGPALISKAGALFGEKINGKIAMLLTTHSDSAASSIGIAYFENPDALFNASENYWQDFLKDLSMCAVIHAPQEVGRGPETGAPPIKLDEGWLIIFCGPDRRDGGKKEWSISAALLDLENPQKIIALSDGPILRPEMPYELEGLVPNVAFPSGAVVVGDALYVYYGGADKVCCLATCKLKDLLSSLTRV